MTEERFTYVFGIFFENRQTRTNRQILSILNDLDEELKLQTEFIEKVAKHYDFVSTKAFIDYINKNGDDLWGE